MLRSQRLVQQTLVQARAQAVTVVQVRLQVRVPTRAQAVTVVQVAQVARAVITK